MKKLFIFFLLVSTSGLAQDEILGDWYHVGTERLVKLRLGKERLAWSEKTFELEPKEGKEGEEKVVRYISANGLYGVVQEDSVGAAMSFSTMIMRYDKQENFIEILMECTNNSHRDTADLEKMLEYCNLKSKMRMRLYPTESIAKFRAMKNVEQMPKSGVSKIRRAFDNTSKELVKEFGEDKLLWIAPIIFQQVLTDLLVNAGYSPFLTRKQAEELFDFFYF